MSLNGSINFQNYVGWNDVLKLLVTFNNILNFG